MLGVAQLFPLVETWHSGSQNINAEINVGKLYRNDTEIDKSTITVQMKMTSSTAKSKSISIGKCLQLTRAGEKKKVKRKLKVSKRAMIAADD